MDTLLTLIKTHPWQSLAILYFLPTLISLINPKSRTWEIFVPNLLGGWTVIHWFWVLLLAFTNTKLPMQIDDPDQDDPTDLTDAPERISPDRANKSKRSGQGFAVGRYVEPAVNWWKNLP